MRNKDTEYELDYMLKVLNSYQFAVGLLNHHYYEDPRTTEDEELNNAIHRMYLEVGKLNEQA